jgi:hypothetical protein
MDGGTGDLITMVPSVFGPDIRTISGAVAELTAHDDGTVTAEIRIPAPQPQRM